MTATTDAIYENGVLRPLAPLPLAEGAHVEVTVTEVASTPSAPAHERAVEIMREIASMPLESDDEGFSGRDHDAVLYGKPSST